MQSHCVYAIVYRHRRVKGRGRRLEFAVLSYRKAWWKTWEIRFPAGTNQPYPAEDLWSTLKRKAREELGVRVTAAHLLDCVRFDPRDPEHVKRAYVVRYADCKGSLRRETIERNSKIMSGIVWMEAEELLRKVCWGHKWALEAAIEHLAAERALKAA